MRRVDFHFELPRELIAQEPAPVRSASRLLALNGASGACRDLGFQDLPALLTPRDLLVFNDTKVIPARVFGRRPSGGRVELLLERALGATDALAHARSAKGLREGGIIELPGGQRARMLGREGDLYRLEFSCDVLSFFEQHGDMPLPPYISRPAASADRERYQTVYARAPGAVDAELRGAGQRRPAAARRRPTARSVSPARWRPCVVGRIAPQLSSTEQQTVNGNASSGDRRMDGQAR